VTDEKMAALRDGEFLAIDVNGEPHCLSARQPRRSG
jgi:hypothetical protein